MILESAWKKHCEMRKEAKGIRKVSMVLVHQGSKGFDVDLKIDVTSRRLIAEGNKLRGQATEMIADSDKLWLESIIKHYGNCILVWDEKGCTLENGDTYTY